MSWNQLGNDIYGEAAGDNSGEVSLSSNGQIVAVAAANNDGNGTDAGHVRIYSYDGSSWNQLGNDIDGETGGDFSGTSVSLASGGGTPLDGLSVAIGAPYNDGNGTDAGHVRVYNLSLTTEINQPLDFLSKISPNPSTGIFTVNVPDQSNFQASVFDALGKLVSTSSEMGTFNLDLSDMPVGIYTLRLDNESGTVTKNLVSS